MSIFRYVYDTKPDLHKMKPMKAIHIEIPAPCEQRWEHMQWTPGGRHCDSCQTEVIDFSTWTDAALYDFFSANKRKVCGKFHINQLNRPIHIPPQPHSRLYRMVVALGLTLLFMPVGDAKAQYKEWPTEMPDTSSKKPVYKVDSVRKPTVLKVVLVDSATKEPIMYASVLVKQNGKLVAGAVTNLDGVADIYGIDAGSYEIVTSYIGYRTEAKQEVSILNLAPGGSPKIMLIEMVTDYANVLGGPFVHDVTRNDGRKHKHRKRR